MVNYGNGKIYKIISNQTESVYVGSTTKKYLCQRMVEHKSAYKSYLCGKSKFTSSFDILKFEDAKIILIENYPCKSKAELLAREQHFIDLIDCINTNRSRTTEEDSKVLRKIYVQENKERIMEYQKKWVEENREKVRNTLRSYRERNKEILLKRKEEDKDKIKEYKKEWWNKQKENLTEEQKQRRKEAQQRYREKLKQ